MDAGFVCSSNPQVRFLVRGREFVTSLDTVTYLPDSYLSWLVANNAENIQAGAPIQVDRHPKVFRRMLERMNQFKEMQVQFNRPDSQDIRANNALEKDCAPRAAMDPKSFPFSLQSSNMTSQSSLYTGEGSSWPSQTNTGSDRTCHMGTPLLEESSSVLSQACTAFNGRPRGPPSREETAIMIEDAVLDIVGLLDRCLHEKRFFDKAVFILTWGQSETHARVLQPYVCHLFDSVTGRMVDVLRATNGNTKSRSWRDFEKLYENANLSQDIQHWIKEGLRKLGFMCCFTDLKIDPENFLHWRLAKNGTNVKTLDRDVALRCLVVSL